VTPDQITNRLRELAGELPGLKDAEQRALEALAEARLTLDAISAECWAETGRGNWQAAADGYAQAERTYRAAAQKLEQNYREAGKVRWLLQQMEAVLRTPAGGTTEGQAGAAETG
jgi:hypothetical protein